MTGIKVLALYTTNTNSVLPHYIYSHQEEPDVIPENQAMSKPQALPGVGS